MKINYGISGIGTCEIIENTIIFVRSCKAKELTFQDYYYLITNDTKISNANLCVCIIFIRYDSKIFQNILQLHAEALETLREL